MKCVVVLYLLLLPFMIVKFFDAVSVLPLKIPYKQEVSFTALILLHILIISY